MINLRAVHLPPVPARTFLSAGACYTARPAITRLLSCGQTVPVW